jgi:Concanavalin A-like lectin/glucanases superfamily
MNHSSKQVFFIGTSSNLNISSTRSRALGASSLTLLIGLAAAWAAPEPSAAVSADAGKLQTAGELVVALDARDPSAGTTNWVNKGTMGNFTRVGAPKVAAAGGQPAVQFNGKSDAYRSEKPTPDTINGAHARSIEVWVNNPTLDSTEECMVAWGYRGETLANLSFNYGSGGGFSAVTHYDQDMGWGDDETPTAGQWHYLVYTYDGKTARIYDNGVRRGAQDFELATAANTRMNIGVENSTEGEPIFESEFDDHWPLSLSGYIAIVRVHSGALTADQIKTNFDTEKTRFDVTAQSAGQSETK